VVNQPIGFIPRIILVFVAASVSGLEDSGLQTLGFFWCGFA
jgi:hypothetical protein